MSYQVLARKWRPATFEQMVGQSHVLHALTNALTQQRLHHAYLFSGTRGVGKTSLARLFAKGLNCEQGVTATPCGLCSACVEIAEGRFVDLIEVDAASRTKVDDTRELLDNVQYRPSRGRFKVYLIDEVHMLSRSSFNALLKTLEEPPEHVKFLLATTDPQRLPVTVLSRCLQFNLKSLSQDEIAGQLGHVLGQEQLSFDASALTLLAKAANGSMRDALSLTDQAIAFGAGQVKLEQVQTMLGSIDEKHVIALLEALTNADIMNLMQVTAKVLSFGAEPEEVLRSLLELLHQITLTQFAPAAAQVSLYSEQIQAFAQQLAAEQVQLYYQLLLTGRKDLPHAPDPKSGLEMALLRAVTFVPEKPVTRWAVDSQSELQIPDVNSVQVASSTATNATAASATTANTTAANTNAPNSPQQTGSALDTQKKTADSVASEEKTEPEPLAALVQSKPQSTQDMADVTTSQQHVAEGSEQEHSVEATNTAVQDERAAEEQDENEPLDSLNSEMAVIMSQAQSQGFEQEPQSSELQSDTPVSAQQAPTNSDANEAKIATQDEASVVTDATSEAESTAETLVANNSANTEQSYASEDDDLASYADYAGAYGDNNDYQDDYGFSQQDVSYQAEQTQVSYSTNQGFNANGNNTDADAQNVSQEQVNNTSQSATSLGTASNALDAGDDILDAVLAARATLLEELTEDAPKEGDSKKSLEVRKPFTPPARKESPVAATVEQEQSTEQAVDVTDTLGAGYSSSRSTSMSSNMSSDMASAPEVIDRPPWEEPHEDNPCARFSDNIDSDNSELAANDNAEAQHEQNVINNTATESDFQQAATNLPASSITDSTAAQEPELNLPALPSGDLTGNEVDLKWYRFMSELEVGGRVRQLAVNSVCHHFEQPLSLLLKPDQKHLAADVAIKQLEEAMSAVLGEECCVQVTVGADHDRETPLEVRRRFHKEILTQVHHDLMTDDNIRWLTQNMGAELTADSLTYAPELLVQKGNRIELIDIANFKRLTES
ncbi:DNA polymerase III subunit gamma/tau [Shewanella pneumatophori]|uniref:DNA-directed DNA polymerase n=1 Tax=Shewanella pneumatophori TaxID=314092 RepID=A0A9X2CHA4_9GAMM|nr:DNA polymerase III subunit gamma/tau [Shewanella pneumatophori]MCL1139831.1 DNA polymerase III subunit gamma/tau [Shewanella pneumatophori]